MRDDFHTLFVLTLDGGMGKEEGKDMRVVASVTSESGLVGPRFCYKQTA